MKIFTFLLLVCIIPVTAGKVFSQDKKLTLNEKEISLDKLFQKIESVSDYRFLYRTTGFTDLSQMVNVNAKDESVSNILNNALTNAGIKYTLVGTNLIVITPSTDQKQFKAVGTVTDQNGEPMVGVTVSIKGTIKAVTTDVKGNFAITTDKNSTLVFSFIGYITQEQKVVEGSTMRISLVPAVNSLDEVVVVGYGTQQKALLTGAISSMTVTGTIKNSPTTSAGNMLAGQISGVSVSTPNGLPGSNPSITIRTQSSWSLQPALYVIDGKIMGAGDFNNLSPNEIDNVSVLKDAASAAVYGSRAAGGVIVVTTKRGSRVGKPVIEYSFNTGYDKRNKNAERTSAVQAGELYQRINPTSDPAGWAWTQSDIDYFKNINNGWGYDQLAEVWRDPSITTHNLSVSGGNDKIKYFVGGSYVKQNAFLENVSYEKYNIRANITAQLTKNIEFFAGLTLNNNINNSTTNTSVGDPAGLYRKLLVWQPDHPVWTKSGNPVDYGWIGNMGAEVRGDGGHIRTDYIKPVINLSATYKAPFLEGLSATAAFSKSYADSRTKTFQKQYTLYLMKKTGLHIFGLEDTDVTGTKMSSQISKSYIREDVSWSGDYQLNFQLNYERTFNNVHHVKGWLVYEKYQTNGAGLTGGIETFPVYLTDQFWAASPARADSYVSGATDYVTGRKSWVGQFFYDYSGKYLASFSYRYDGSMNFAPDKRWGFFPAGSLGWNISKESFFKVKGIETLKLRASAGITGNDNVGGWQWLEAYRSGNNTYLGTNPSTNVGITYGSVVNKVLTWEKSLNYNAGIDAQFLKHFNASIEYYLTNTYDILGLRTGAVPVTFSPSLPSENYGKVQAKGIELTLGYRNVFDNVDFYSNLTASYGSAKYISIDDGGTSYDYQNNTGRYTSRVTGYVFDKILRTQAELDAFKTANPTYNFNGIAPALGQMVYKDLSGPAGTPDGIINNYDITTLKKKNNSVVLGLNLGASWKGFSVDAVFSGNLGFVKSMNDLAGGVEWNRMWKAWYDQSWTTTNPNAALPQRLSANDGTKTYTSTSMFWLKDASYLRMKNLNIGYTIPTSLYSKLGIGGVKVYFSGSNLFMFSKFNKNYYDPEIGDGFSYPNMRSYNVGVNVSF